MLGTGSPCTFFHGLRFVAQEWSQLRIIVFFWFFNIIMFELSPSSGVLDLNPLIGTEEFCDLGQDT